jgi:hypothetical protein
MSSDVARAEWRGILVIRAVYAVSCDRADAIRVSCGKTTLSVE